MGGHHDPVRSIEALDVLSPDPDGVGAPQSRCEEDFQRKACRRAERVPCSIRFHVLNSPSGKAALLVGLELFNPRAGVGVDQVARQRPLHDRPQGLDCVVRCSRRFRQGIADRAHMTGQHLLDPLGAVLLAQLTHERSPLRFGGVVQPFKLSRGEVEVRGMGQRAFDNRAAFTPLARWLENLSFRRFQLAQKLRRADLLAHPDLRMPRRTIIDPHVAVPIYVLH